MREILFRGKRINNGKWIEGSLTKKINSSHIIREKIVGCVADYTEYEVDPETVCQYTGLTDKNGRKIFEGDIVSYAEEYEVMVCPDNGATYFPRSRTTKKVNSVVKYDLELCSVVVNPISKENHVRKSIKDYNFKNLEVIGNIFDNPELIGDQP